MNNNSLSCTIVFESPFYKAIFEEHLNKAYSVATLTLGPSEPKIEDIYYFILFNWKKLNFYKTTSDSIIQHRKINPKRLQRVVKKQILQNKAVGTKAQNAIKKQHDEIKKVKRTNRRTDKLEQKEKKFQLTKKKRQQKHKGH
ncbi:YjdF family protein [Lapidilactobacillus mulanensis]|uniref:YjdF family protein n=2 Tax=Lactobacillaceae TaxID=33958 RepID=A0ABW4DLN4_9LACO|nr:MULTISPECIES: YjdF family protein [Lactobacillaceae]